MPKYTLGRPYRSPLVRFGLKFNPLVKLRVLFEVALKDVLHVPEDVAHVEHVLGARQVDKQVSLGAVLTLELLAHELGCKLQEKKKSI